MAKKKSKWAQSEGGDNAGDEVGETQKRPKRSLAETQPDASQKELGEHAKVSAETPAASNGAPPETQHLDITDTLVEDFGRWGMKQDPKTVHAAIRNAIGKGYSRPFEDFARLFKRYLQEKGLAK